MAYFPRKMSSETCFTEMLWWCERRFPNQPPCWSGLSNQVQPGGCWGSTARSYNAPVEVEEVHFRNKKQLSGSFFFSSSPRNKKTVNKSSSSSSGKTAELSELIQKSCFQAFVWSCCFHQPSLKHGKPTKGRMNNLLAERKEGRTNNETNSQLD